MGAFSAHTHTRTHTYTRTRTHPLYHPPDGSVSRLANIEIGRRAVRGLEKACPFQALNQKIGSFCRVVFSPLFLCKDLFRGFDLTYYEFTLIPCTLNNRLWSNGLCLYAFTTLQILLCRPRGVHVARIDISCQRRTSKALSGTMQPIHLGEFAGHGTLLFLEGWQVYNVYFVWSFSVLIGQNGRRFISFTTPGISRRKSDLCNPSNQH